MKKVTPEQCTESGFIVFFERALHAVFAGGVSTGHHLSFVRPVCSFVRLFDVCAVFLDMLTICGIV